jgi:hypothetical protein
MLKFSFVKDFFSLLSTFMGKGKDPESEPDPEPDPNPYL